MFTQSLKGICGKYAKYESNFLFREMITREKVRGNYVLKKKEDANLYLFFLLVLAVCT